MSKKRKLSSKGREIASLIRKFKRQHPTAARGIVRKVIRLENPQLFKTLDSTQNETNLQMLDRYLKEPSMYKRARKIKSTARMHESGSPKKCTGKAPLYSRLQFFTVYPRNADEPSLSASFLRPF